MTDKEVERLIEKRAEIYVEDVPYAANIPDTPELLYFSSIIKDAKKRIARRQNVQFAIFIVVALMVAIPMMLCLFTSVALFAALQLVPIALFVVLRLRARHTEATR